jgi:uncharacterized membrane protein YqiK
MTLEQEQQVKTRTAEQNAKIAAFEAERHREAEQTRILAERQIQETEIEREQAVRSRKVEAEREVRIKEIEQQQVTEIANQTKSIAIAAKSEQQSQAEARQRCAGEAVRAQQNVETTRQTAEADRAKQVALIAAAQDAETKAVELTYGQKPKKKRQNCRRQPSWNWRKPRGKRSGGSRSPARAERCHQRAFRRTNQPQI